MSGNEQVFEALRSLYDPNSTSDVRKAANEFLEGFRRQPEAWVTANLILQAPDAPEQAKLFAAQTFRAKVLYDFNELPQDSRSQLRDSFLNFLITNASSSRIVNRQICLALADLLLQYPDWKHPLDDVTSKLGQDPTLVPTFLEFLTVLPQELLDNNYLDSFVDSIHDVQTDNVSEKILNLLTMYYTAQGVSGQIQRQTFVCLTSWLRAGEITSSQVSETSLMGYIFDRLATSNEDDDDDLFEKAVDTAVELIHETQEIYDNQQVIEKIVGYLINLRPLIRSNHEDSDRMRAYARVFAEAGEWYAPLIVQHADSFLPIVESLAECSSYSDLEIVSITFEFWRKLTYSLRSATNSANVATLVNVYSHLYDIIIRHLTYPQDESSLTAQEKDDFRSFRHSIGDTLKDCCQLIGATNCLERAYNLVNQAYTTQQPWQIIEAPLFAIRAMGAKVDPSDTQVLPQILQMLPKLPAHPSIQYTAILVVARYTAWIDDHPEQIPAQLSFVSSGFESPQDNVRQAAAQAMLFLCEDCRNHLENYFPQLLQFLHQVQDKLDSYDVKEIITGLAHVITVMDIKNALNSLSQLCKPIIVKIGQIVANSTIPASKQILIQVSDLMEQLTEVLVICSHFGSSDAEFIKTSCESTFKECWQIMDLTLTKFGNDVHLTERACTLIRHGFDLFYSLVPTCAIQILDRLSERFSATHLPEYLWVTSKLVPIIQSEKSPEFEQSIRNVFENESSIVISLQTHDENIMEDFTSLLGSMNRFFPKILANSANLEGSLTIAISAISALSPRVVRNALDFFLDLISEDHPDSISKNERASNIVLSKGQELTNTLIHGFVAEFDDPVSAITLGRVLGEKMGSNLVGWAANSIASLPPKGLGTQPKEDFMKQLSSSMESGSLNGVKKAFQDLDRASRKARDRLWREQQTLLRTD